MGTSFPRLVQTGEWRGRPWVPDKHPDGVGHQEGIIQRPKKFLVVVLIWKTNIRATSAWPPFCVPSPWLLPWSCPPFPKAWSPWELLGHGQLPSALGAGPVLDFTTCCCPLAQGHGTDLHHLITSGCLMSSWLPAKPWPRPGVGEWGQPNSAATSVGFGVPGGTQPYQRGPSCTMWCC